MCRLCCASTHVVVQSRLLRSEQVDGGCACARLVMRLKFFCTNYRLPNAGMSNFILN